MFLRFDGGEQYCLSTERSSKQTNDPVFTSEHHVDCEVNKKKEQEQGSTGTPRLALSDVTGLESLSVLSASLTALRCAAHRKQQLGYQAVKPVTQRQNNTAVWLTTYFTMAAAPRVMSL